MSICAAVTMGVLGATTVGAQDARAECPSDYCVSDAAGLAAAFERPEGHTGETVSIVLESDIDLDGRRIGYDQPPGLEIKSAEGARYELSSGVVYAAARGDVTFAFLALQDVSLMVEQTAQLTIRDVYISATQAMPGDGVIGFTGERMDVIDSRFENIDLRGTSAAWVIGASRDEEPQELYLSRSRFRNISMDDTERTPYGLVFNRDGYVHVDATNFIGNSLKTNTTGHALTLILHGGRVVLSGDPIFENNRIHSGGNQSLAALVMAYGPLDMGSAMIDANELAVGPGGDATESVAAVAVAGEELMVTDTLLEDNTMKAVKPNGDRVDTTLLRSLNGELDIDEATVIRNNEPPFDGDNDY